MVIFVGDKPSPRMKPGAKLFEGAACEKRLMEWIKELEVKIYQIYNSDPAYWPEFSFQMNDLCGIKFIALGNKADNRLKRLGIKPFRLPHPSGLNRQHNNPEFIKQKLAECKEYIKGVN